MSRHIELVEKWLKNGDSVSVEEAQANAQDAADASAAAAYPAALVVATHAADGAARAIRAAAKARANTTYWVYKYKELTK
jgi:hypothetical protein